MVSLAIRDLFIWRVCVEKPEVCKSSLDMDHIETVFIRCALSRSLAAEYVEGFEAIYDIYISTSKYNN